MNFLMLVLMSIFKFVMDMSYYLEEYSTFFFYSQLNLAYNLEQYFTIRKALRKFPHEITPPPKWNLL